MADGPSQEVLKDALADIESKELKEMGQRLLQNRASLEEALAELEADNVSITAENAKICETIELVHEDLKKLNIGADNLSEPRLDEGPQDYVRRFWERVRPRDSAVPVNEHIGEIRKPDVETAAFPDAAFFARNGAVVGQQLQDNLAALPDQMAEQLSSISDTISQAAVDLLPPGENGESTPGQRLAEHGQELHKRVTEHVGSFSENVTSASHSARQAATNLSQQSPEEVGNKVVEKTQKLSRKVTAKFSSFSDSIAKSASDLVPEDGADVGEHFAAKGQELRKSVSEQFSLGWSMFSQQSDTLLQTLQGSSAPQQQFARRDGYDQDGSSASSASSSAASARAAYETEALRSPSASSEVPASTRSTPSLEQPPVAESGDDKVELDETVLIEAKISLDGEPVATLRVLASDRCGEVAKKYIRDHSLKAQFEAPLKAFLMAAENDAEKFPVHLEADLLDIKEKHAKS